MLRMKMLGGVLAGSAVLLAWGMATSAQAQQSQFANGNFTQLPQFTNVNYANAPGSPNINVPLLREGNIKLGPIALHPHFGMAESVTDNQFRVSQPFGTRERESVTFYAPGIQAQLPVLGRHMLVLDYMAFIERHSRFHLDNIEDQRRAAMLLLDFPGGLTVRGGVEWKDGHDPRGSAVATAGVGSTPNQWFATTYGGEVKLESQTFARLRLKSTRWEFIGVNAGPRDGVSPGDINTRNRLENYVALAAGGRVAPKTYLYLEGSAEQSIYEINKDLDNSVYSADVGAKWEVTAKTQGDLKVGWQRRASAEASTRGSGTFSGLHVDGAVSWQPQERTAVALSVYRRTNETVIAGTTFFASTGANLSLTQAFTAKWRVNGLIGYDHDSYSDPIFSPVDGKTATRKDDYFTAEVGLWYQIQPWLGARATYTHNERLSTFDSNQYTANGGMISLQAQF